jgi:uncharacterized protein (TIGR02996 family)
MSNEQGFLDAIRANPGDDVHRLVYADWLVEHDDLRGRYLRLEIELAGLEEDDSRGPLLESELRELRQEHDPAWLEQVGKRFDVWLLGYTPMIKVPVIKAIRQVTALGLKEAKDLSEQLPSTILGDVLLERAEQAREILQTAPAWSLVAPPEGEVRVAVRPARSPQPRPAPTEQAGAASEPRHALRLVDYLPHSRMTLIAAIRRVTGRSLPEIVTLLEGELPAVLAVFPSHSEATAAAAAFAGLAEVEVRAMESPTRGLAKRPGGRLFDVVLKSFPPENRMRVIKALREVLGCALVEARDVSERPFPILLARNAPEPDAERLRRSLEEVADVELREVPAP